MVKNEIGEIARKLTYEEFMEHDYFKNACPSAFNLKEFTEKTCKNKDYDGCNRCWKRAVKDIKFKL